jgi:exodeoxyribonuclease V alpha subunit
MKQAVKRTDLMKALINWSPLGSGVLAMGLAGKKEADTPYFPADLMPRLKQLDLGIEAVYLAWEIARLAAEETSPGQQRALILLLLAAQLASAEGSTRLPLSPGGHLERALDEFGTTAEELADIESLLDEAKKLCSGPAGHGPAGSGLADLFGGPGDYRPLIIDHNCLYLQKLHVLEDRVGKMLRARIVSEAAGAVSETVDGKLDQNIEDALIEVFDRPPVGVSGLIALDAEQKQAVRTALSGRIAIISGRPGSGKTSIVASLLRVLARTGSPPLESMALAAPTGKAADRMRQAIANHLGAISDRGEADRRLAEACPPSSTLHRLLRYSPGQDRFWHNENNPLAEQFVVVDESSMIDLAMMDRLLHALQPEARVVLLGDADQLPSIDTGAVLRDLCRSGKANKQGRVVVLQKSYRAREEDSGGKSILEISSAINAGISPAKADGGRTMVQKNHVSELIFKGVELLWPGDETMVHEFFAKWRERLKDALPDLQSRLVREYASGSSGFDGETTKAMREVLDYYERFRILCVTRVTAGGTGSMAVNAWFHHQWSEDLQMAGMATGTPFFMVGEPVLITRNDYNLRLFNGDSGLVLMVKPSTETGQRTAEPMAVFPRAGSFVAYPLEMLRGRLELAWATTVHKAQGSEYDNVAILLPEVHVRPLTRELLYTAVTRAKKSVVIVGSGEVLESGVKRTIDRASGLDDLIS